MRIQKRIVLALGGAMLAVGHAQAAGTMTVDKVTITGSQTVPTQKLLDAIQERVGSKVEQSDIVADRDTIMKVLEDNHVGGKVGASIATKPNKHVIVTFIVEDQGVQAPVVTTVAPKLHEQMFDGNKSIPSDKLAAATGLQPGVDMSNDKLMAAEKAILAVYSAAKLPVNVGLSGETKALPGGTVDVIWHVTETKAKKKRNDSDQEGRTLDQ
jgi:outer membrane protein assembly factor BamA